MSLISTNKHSYRNFAKQMTAYQPHWTNLVFERDLEVMRYHTLLHRVHRGRSPGHVAATQTIRYNWQWGAAPEMVARPRGCNTNNFRKQAVRRQRVAPELVARPRCCNTNKFRKQAVRRRRGTGISCQATWLQHKKSDNFQWGGGSGSKLWFFVIGTVFIPPKAQKTKKKQFSTLICTGYRSTILALVYNYVLQ